MPRILSQVLFSLSLVAVVLAESDSESKQAEESKAIAYQSLEIRKSLFGDFSMLAQERDDYATTLTRLALENVHVDPNDEKGIAEARRLIALALHLSPRNRTAVVSNHQLGKGLLPEKKEADYSRLVFARLLLTRGRLLKEQKGEADQFVGRCFIELAAQLNPRNEEAVYDFEIQKFDNKEVDWSVFTAQEAASE